MSIGRHEGCRYLVRLPVAGEEGLVCFGKGFVVREAGSTKRDGSWWSPMGNRFGASVEVLRVLSAQIHRWCKGEDIKVLRDVAGDVLKLRTRFCSGVRFETAEFQGIRFLLRRQ
jgi:hypothetical protein